MLIRGVEMGWVERWSLQLTNAPAWYSLCARIEGRLCGSCDLGLPFDCSCPESVPLDNLPSLW